MELGGNVTVLFMVRHTWQVIASKALNAVASIERLLWLDASLQLSKLVDNDQIAVMMA